MGQQLADDTQLAAEETQVRIWRSWTPEQQIEAACNLLTFVRQRVNEAIREQYPNLSDDEVRIHFLRRAYGEDIAARVARYQGLVVEAYIARRVIPADPAGDALHLALASLHRCDFLVTWNCKHLANANKFGHIRRVNTLLGIYVPGLVTPLELQERSDEY